MIKTDIISYQDNQTTLEGYCAFPANLQKKTPAVLIAHDWSGRNTFACDKAKLMAECGYIGFALDMYGHAKIGESKEEKMALIQPFMQDRKKLQHRMIAALHTLQTIEHVNPQAISAIGFCFGGLCVLDLARTGTEIKSVISVHGLLQAPELPANIISAKVLALHGFDDPMVTPDQVIAFGKEMTKSQADWQIHMYGHTMHAFTNPEAHDAAFGTVYNKIANDRAWISIQNFLKETLI